MHLIIVGAGPVGNSLIALAQNSGYDVVMIEGDEARATHCADRYDARVLHMDIADDDVVQESAMEQAKALIATSTDDSTNLMAMFLGREHGVETLTSTVNHHAHKALFEKLGVHVLADPEILVAQHLLDMTLLPRAADVTTLQDKEQIIEVTLDASSPLAGHTLGEVAESELVPRGLFIVSVDREGEPTFPTASTEMKPGDNIIVFSRSTIRHEDLAVFTGGEA